MNHPVRSRGVPMLIVLFSMGLYAAQMSHGQAGNAEPRTALPPLLDGMEAGYTESSYIVFIDGPDIKALNGHTGSIEFSGTEASQVIQQAIDAASDNGGGRIFIKPGAYAINNRIDIGGKEAQYNLTIEGTDGTILTSTSSAAILIDNHSSNITLYRLTLKDCAQKGIHYKSGSNVKFIECVFENLWEPAIHGLKDDPDHPLENVWIVGCRFSAVDLLAQDSPGGGFGGNHGKNNKNRKMGGSAQGELKDQTTSAHGAIHLFRPKNLLIQDNIIEGCGSIGISIHRDPSHVICADNIVRDNDVNHVYGQGHGIYISDGSDVEIRGNIITGNGGNGIEAVGDTGSSYILSGNVCNNNGRHWTGPNQKTGWRNGIYVTGMKNLVSQNICMENGGAGIKVGYANHAQLIILEGNVIGDNGAGGSSNKKFASGIVLSKYSGGAVPPTDPDQRIIVKDNLIFTDPLSGTQVQGIHCAYLYDPVNPDDDRVDGIVIEENRLIGHQEPQIEFSEDATNMTVRRNAGFRTEAGGEATIQDEDTFISIEHGLEVDPTGTGHCFQVTPQTNLAFDGNTRNFWIANVTQTSFEIHVSAYPGIGNSFAFCWTYIAP